MRDAVLLVESALTAFIEPRRGRGANLDDQQRWGGQVACGEGIRGSDQEVRLHDAGAEHDVQGREEHSRVRARACRS